MRHRLDHRQAVFAGADPALEKRREAVGGGARRCEMGRKPPERAVMVVDQLVQAQRQPGEGQLVPAKHQVLVARERQEAFAALQPVGHRIGLGLGGIDADVRRDRRQDLIAGDHQVVVAAPEGGMRRGMAIAEMHGPAAAAHGDLVTLGDPMKPQRQRRHDIGEIERPLGAAFRQDLGVHAAGAPEGQGFLGGPVLFVQRQHPRHQPGGAGGPDLGAMGGFEPAHHAGVIGVMVGHHHAAHGFAGERPGKQPVPERAAAFRRNAAVDHRPAVAIIERINVDMVQRHGQRQAHPEHTQRHLRRRALGGWLGPGIADAGGVAVPHQEARSSGLSA